LRRLLDAQCRRAPIDGVPRRTESLAQTTPRAVHDKRGRRWMRLMGWQALSPQPRPTLGSRHHAVLPSLWRGVASGRPQHGWSTDLTDVPRRHGCRSLVAILDWYRRDGLAGEWSKTRDGECCLTTLEPALPLGKPEICHTDQGAPCTAEAVTGRLQAAGSRGRMEGRGRAFDHIVVARRWRTVTDEDLDRHDDASVAEWLVGLRRDWHGDQHERRHQRLGYHPPVRVHLACGAVPLTRRGQPCG
jgi:putative transposase